VQLFANYNNNTCFFKREEYIEQEMKKRGLVDKIDAAMTNTSEHNPFQKQALQHLQQQQQLTMKDLERKLYEMPEHLKPKVQLFKEDPSNSVVVTNVLTGITEVQLPNEFKYQNIEATEKAKYEKRVEKREKWQKHREIEKLLQVPAEEGKDAQNENNDAEKMAPPATAATRSQQQQTINYNALNQQMRPNAAASSANTAEPKLKVVEEIVEEDGTPVNNDQNNNEQEHQQKKQNVQQQGASNITGEKRKRSHDQMLFDKYKKKFQRY